ncbi:MAG: hypothetical protein JWN94_2986 [Betaproteobacteria bacterium]|nr:hypothetical protein [Betaproteobacteria bacterium]
MNLRRFFILAVIVIAAAIYHLRPWSVDLPQYSSQLTNQWLNQGWSNDDRHWFHHATQGTNTFGLPYEWFIALEQPVFVPWAKMFADQDYLARFGFIQSPSSLADRQNASRLGFGSNPLPAAYPDSKHRWNEFNLPVGFAVSGDWYDPRTRVDLPIYGTGRKARSLGLTCAACHTGQLEYESNRLLIDGGAGMISLDKFRVALQTSLKYTALSGKLLPMPHWVPTRFNRFAKRVLGDAYADESNRDAFKQQFMELAGHLKTQAELEELQTKLPNAVEEGYTRLDALNRIGNEVFQAQMGIRENMHPISGPVSFPYIWNAPWFNWVQYNSSIMQPMVRNLGEAMGVKGKVNLVDNSVQTFDASGIPVEHLHEMEMLLRGDEHPLKAKEFRGLRSPRWDKPLPELDASRVQHGAKLYSEICVHCHLPPLHAADRKIFDEAKYWQTPTTGLDANAPAVKEFQALLKVSQSKEEKFLALVTKPVMDIGTDCRAAYDMVYRTVSTPDFIGNSGTDLRPLAARGPAPAGCELPTPSPARKDGFRLTNFGVALGEVVAKTKQHWYEATNKTGKEQLAFDGERPNGIRATVAGKYPYDDPRAVDRELPAYKARPLNGVWATAPFLHNGSVPNLYLLLSPQDKREAEARMFWTGNREFDPKYVGYAYRSDAGTLKDVPLIKDTTGLFRLDTTKAGNRNTGHLFTKDETAAGRIGREFTDEERFAIIEYLKSL